MSNSENLSVESRTRLARAAEQRGAIFNDLGSFLEGSKTCADAFMRVNKKIFG
jgi:hypothetical protein